MVDLEQRSWRVPPSRLLHLQFRRFAGCPICNLHLASVAHRIDEIEARGIQEVVVFRSSRAALQAHQGSLPFPIVPDPEHVLCRAFGVKNSMWSMASPKAWRAAALGISFATVAGAPESVDAALGQPADFLIDPSGRIIACHYGRHASDQWSVDDLLAQVP